MRQIVQDYLEKADPKLLDAMTSEEQRYVEKQEQPKKGKKTKPPKEEDAADSSD